MPEGVLQGDDPVGHGIMVAFYGGLLCWLYYLVRRHTHPSRSLVLSYLATLAVIVAFIVVAFIAAMGIASATGNMHNPSKAIVGMGA